jgi:hypothetical protein
MVKDEVMEVYKKERANKKSKESARYWKANAYLQRAAATLSQWANECVKTILRGDTYGGSS